MRICIFQSSYQRTEHTLEPYDNFLGPSRHANSHNFETHLIHKSTAEEEIDVAVAEGWDFYSGSFDQFRVFHHRLFQKSQYVDVIS